MTNPGPLKWFEQYWDRRPVRQGDLREFREDNLATYISVVNAGSNLATPRPEGAGVVMWKFAAGVDVGTGGANVVNRQSGDLIFVAS